MGLLPGLMLLLFSAALQAEPVSVIDSRGETIRLTEPARRIVTLAPHLAENLFAAGGGSRLVGTVEYSDHPTAAREVPRIGGYNSLSLEAIVASRPDLVLAWGSGNGTAIVERLESLGIPVYVDEIRDLASISGTLAALGRLAGSAGQGAIAAERLARGFAELGPAPGSHRLRVFYQLWHDPMQTVGGSHLISAVIERCGGENLFAEVPSLVPRVSRESVLARDPEVIIASGAGKETPPWLEAWRRFPRLAAVAHNALYGLNPDLIQRPTPRLLDGARALCALLAEARARY
ncbi:cobalamin-binding protein [Pseudohaliea rubra]|uniref:Vitamin B12 ABC transporter, B12-binding protein component BtuF n=1 Tax=Pseudohaliea rubra DSM 19751 TaxID=1265313 RepID=A0A095VUB8_9GAMM|nr:cobalamin-binding protein [Pseudohaliea rubra]KGE04970.1 Vitamin B12 ABC transporter, B12-binding protein component BtuF [Pseudohaliea rubra DSM 19751]